MPRHHPRTADLVAEVQLVVTDQVGVQRVLMLLTGRRHAVTRFEARQTGADRWQLSLDTADDQQELQLLEARLLRLPTVLTVEVLRPAGLAAAG
jgi:hypothetical protein